MFFESLQKMYDRVSLVSWLIEVLRTYPELTLFLTLAFGYQVGKIHFGSFKVGTVPGVLITGVLVGQFGVTIDNTVKSIFFLLFLFALGYNAGPQFFKGLKKEGISQVLFSCLVCLIGFVLTIVIGKLMNFNAGQASGLLAGALTQSSVIGVAQDALSKLEVSNQSVMMDFVPVGYAVTYIFGTIGCTFILTTFSPKILKIDLEEECVKLDNQSKDQDNLEVSYASQTSEVLYRLYEVDERYIGKTVADMENQLGNEVDLSLFIMNPKRQRSFIFPTRERLIKSGDCLAVAFKEKDISKIKWTGLGKEIFDNRLDELRNDSAEVYIGQSNCCGKTVGEIQRDVLKHGVLISKVKRQGESLDYHQGTKLFKQDVLCLEGPTECVDSVIPFVGTKVVKTDETDMTFMGLGIVLGGIIGIPALMIGKIGITLSMSGGVLIMGLLCGYLHSRRPTIGQIPSAATWFLSNVGLAVFVAVVGINAGPGFVAGLQSSGFVFFLAGVLVTSLSTLSGILLGKYVFKFSPPVILGATAGALTTTAALGGLCEKAKSNAPVLGYTIPYAVGNILLTIWGSLIIMFFS